MFARRILGVGCLVIALGCSEKQDGAGSRSHPAVSREAIATVPRSEESAREDRIEAPVENPHSAPPSLSPPPSIAETLGRSASSEFLAMNSSKNPLPPAEFEKGDVTSREFDAEAISTDERGFTIRMPSESPIPTPTVHGGRLYASGGFSSQEFYCFDAISGAFVWGVDLSDDGPSVAVPSGDDIIFNSESCTIFALNAASGELRWAHYMGDPMMAAPSVAGGRVFTVYPAELVDSLDETENESEDAGDAEEGASAPLDPVTEPDAIAEAGQPSLLQPSYNIACLDADSGEVLWRRWIDGDCITAPVAVDEEVFVATLPGTLYRLRADDGTILAAHHARATSAPLVTDGRLFFTKRIDDHEQGEPPTEAIVAIDRHDESASLLALHKPAPYLDRFIQEASDATRKANEAESFNGILGGFGGGFYSIPGERPPVAPLEHVPDEEKGHDPTSNFESIPLAPGHTAGEPVEVAQFGGVVVDSPNDAAEMPAEFFDPLAKMQQSAADNLGLGNVSTLQAFHGSRLIHYEGRNFNCMGDELICTSAESGEKLWSVALEGNLEQLGGHLAAPPVVVEEGLFLATLVGDVLRIDPSDGRIVERYAIGSELRFPPVVSNGRLYVGSQDGKVVCIRIETSASAKP